MSVATPNKENIVALNPVYLSPANVQQSPHGLAFDVLIKPASANKKLVSLYSPSPSKDCSEKLRSAEKRLEHMQIETQEKLRQKHEKLKAAKCHVLESIENHQRQTIESLQKKELTAEECKINKQKELEEKRVARELRAQEAKKLAEANIENKRKLAEQQLAQLKLAEEMREANRLAIAEKGKKEVEKAKTTVAAQKEKLVELDKQIQIDLQNAEMKRMKQLNCIKEKCANHVQDAKNRAMLKERN